MKSVWIFDDIHWSKDMEEAWEIIKNHPQVTVTIDTFQWGIVFFRKEQEKEHFVIRVQKKVYSSFIFEINKNLIVTKFISKFSYLIDLVNEYPTFQNSKF